jgi:hypothetical protein
VKIGVIVGVVDVPVCVDHGFQRRIAQAIEDFFQLWPGRHQKRVDHDFSVRPVEHHKGPSLGGFFHESFLVKAF